MKSVKLIIDKKEIQLPIKKGTENYCHLHSGLMKSIKLLKLLPMEILFEECR